MTAKEKAALRDEIAIRMATVCMADLSRQLADERMPIQDSEKAIRFIARLSYGMADEMLKAREGK